MVVFSALLTMYVILHHGYNPECTLQAGERIVVDSIGDLALKTSPSSQALADCGRGFQLDV